VKLAFATQAVDPADPVLAATVPMVRALAARVDELVVLADRVDRASLPANARAHVFGARSKAGRGARFVTALARERPDALLAHMAPVYALLAASARVPVLLWFTQQGGGRLLRGAERVSRAVLTVDARSFPLASRKVHAIGHGIDLEQFPSRGVPPNPSNKLLLGLGRYAPVKGWETAIRAVAEVPGAQLALYGPMLTDADRRHRPELEQLVRELAAPVELHDAVPRAEVPRLLADADALLNPTRGNAADKVVFEAAASCVAPLAASPVFDDLLPSELRFPAGDAAALAARIRGLGTLDAALGQKLRARVAAEHSVEHWADGVLSCL
jgi:glycosyltransferase involved in cell wall biosynthesis